MKWYIGGHPKFWALSYFASDSQSVSLDLEPLCDFYSYTITGLMLRGVLPDGKTGVFSTWTSTGVFFTWPPLKSSLLDPLLDSSSLDALWSLFCSTLYWSLLYSTLYWILLHLTLSGVSLARPSTGVFFTWPSLESSLLDPLLDSSSLDALWSLFCSTLYWNLLYMTLLGVFFTRPSTGVWVTCNWQSVSQSVSHSDRLSWHWVSPNLCRLGCHPNLVLLTLLQYVITTWRTNEITSKLGTTLAPRVVVS
jgi:hypothetical protein